MIYISKSDIPSESFKSIISLVIKIQNKNLQRLKICVVFASFLNRIANNFLIDSSIETIPLNAFSDCSSLAQITIPSTVIQIRKCSFSECKSLTQIIFPSSVTQIGNYAFSFCSKLTQITIPSSVTRIGDFAFACFSLLKQIEIPSSVTQIGKNVLFLDVHH